MRHDKDVIHRSLMAKLFSHWEKRTRSREKFIFERCKASRRSDAMLMKLDVRTERRLPGLSGRRVQLGVKAFIGLRAFFFFFDEYAPGVRSIDCKKRLIKSIRGKEQTVY